MSHEQQWVMESRSRMDLPLKMHVTKIRHEITFSRKSPGHVSNVTFSDLVPEQSIEPIRAHKKPCNAAEIRFILPMKCIVSNDKFDMDY